MDADVDLPDDSGEFIDKEIADIKRSSDSFASHDHHL